MAKVIHERPRPKGANPKRALQLLEQLKREGLGDRFAGMSDDEVIHALRKTRDLLWKEKLADRP